MKKALFLLPLFIAMLVAGCGEPEQAPVTEGSIKPVPEGAQQSGQKPAQSDTGA